MNIIKALSHHILGKYLAATYFPDIPKRYTKAFLFGCTQPDKNPTTYLKGSIRCHPLQGHHWFSSQKYMGRIANRLQGKQKLKLLDFYTLGKLIHYTADAFTASHNANFPMNLAFHRAYESALQDRFLSYICKCKFQAPPLCGSIMDAINKYHQAYSKASDQMAADCHYTILTCSAVVSMLVASNTVYIN